MTTDIEKAKAQAEQFAPEAAKWQAEYDDLRRREPSVLAKCISNYHVEPKLPEKLGDPLITGTTYQWTKNAALQDEKYLFHLDQMKQAQERYLAAEKAFRTIIEYLKAVQSENYKQQAKFKAGIL
jgi:hypothetical protein